VNDVVEQQRAALVPSDVTAIEPKAGYQRRPNAVAVSTLIDSKVAEPPSLVG
jgi:hypothetical protein